MYGMDKTYLKKNGPIWSAFDLAQGSGSPLLYPHGTKQPRDHRWDLLIRRLRCQQNSRLAIAPAAATVVALEATNQSRRQEVSVASPFPNDGDEPQSLPDPLDGSVSEEFEISLSADDAEIEALLSPGLSSAAELPRSPGPSDFEPSVPAPSHPMTANKPAPLSRDRIEEALRAEGWTFSIDSDGDIGGQWDSNGFYFFIYGEQKEILQIRGRWHQSLPLDMRSQVRELLDDWHFTKIWPKGYTTVDDSGRIWVLAEHSVDWENGVTDEQLRLTLRCGITTSLSLFRRLEENFVTLAPKNQEPPSGWS
jgi:hypothetical protein